MKPKVKLLTFTAKNIKMKQLLFLFLLIGFSSNIYGQTFLNGSFEINNATYCMINNIKNAQFNLLMNNVRGIGEAETIDIFYDKICPSYGSAQSGHYFVSVENNGKDSTQSTIISLKLTDPLQNGMPYNFFFYDKSINLGNNSVKIGVSNTDSTFGTLIYTTSFIDTIWTMKRISFNSPTTANYVTVKYGGASLGGAFVDNFGVFDAAVIDKQTDIERLKVFPMPFSNQLTFTLTGNSEKTIILYDFLGRQITQQTFTNTTTINTEQLAKGIYIFTVLNKNGIIRNGKVIKD
jgi:hypothetical protein